MKTLLGKAQSYGSKYCDKGIRMLDFTEGQKKNIQAADISFLREMAGDWALYHKNSANRSRKKNAQIREYYIR